MYAHSFGREGGGGGEERERWTNRDLHWLTQSDIVINTRYALLACGCG